MKKLLLILTIFITSVTFAQDPDQVDKPLPERVEALKIAFISQRLELTPDEAQKFWPIYKNYETELRQLLRDQKGNNDPLERDKKINDLRFKFRPEFARIIGQPRANKLFGAEHEFRRVLMEQLKNRGNKQRPPMRRQN